MISNYCQKVCKNYLLNFRGGPLLKYELFNCDSSNSNDPYIFWKFNMVPVIA